MRRMVSVVCAILVVGCASTVAAGEESSGIDVSGTAEIGALRALVHNIQIGEDGYQFDYVQEGGQELLLPYYRFEADAVIGDRHEIALLYQPLTLETQTRVDNDGGILIDDVNFADDTPLDLQYGFDFYRGTYRYRVLDDETRFSIGGGLQIRNASIVFDGYREDEEGRLVDARTTSQDLSPVPVISTAFRRDLAGGQFVEATLDGFYAPVRYLNLRDVDVIGWLYDASIRVGTPLYEDTEAYLSLRFLGGGSDGTAAERTRWTQSRDEPRYTRNNLNLAVLSIGARL